MPEPQATDPFAPAPEPLPNPFTDMHAVPGDAGQPMAPIQPAPDGFASAPSLNPFEQPLQQDAGNPFAMAPGAPGSPGIADPNAFAGNDDFIAAARRAAQAASQQKSLFSGISPGAARMSEESSRKLLNLSFFKKKPKAAAAPSVGLSGEIKPPPGFKAANSNTENKRRKLLLMGLVLLAAVSAFTFNMVGRSHKTKAPVAPAAIEQSIQQDQNTSGNVIPGQGGAVPAAPAVAPAPAPLDSGALESNEADPILTGSLPQTLDTKPISALVAGEAASPENLPPAEVGAMALREAASLGDPAAQFVIATRYLNGEKVQQNFEKAAYWYGKAAAQGNAPAQYRLATMYERGRGVAKDLKAALGWYERAGSLGNVKSMHNAAVLASGNEMGEPDYKRAFKWFSLAASHGLKDSQFNLAVLLERGLGTEVNKTDAWFWYSVAGQQNDPDAKSRAQALTKTMSQSEMLLAKTRLSAWSPEKPPVDANVVAINNGDWNVQMNVGG